MTIVIVLSIFVAGAVAQTDYCSPILCPSSSPHIACNNTGAWGPLCPSNARLIDLTPYIDFILKLHNTKRNEIAGGELSGYEPAKRMATMQWDAELANVALYSVKECEKVYGICHNTERFRYSGQNLGWYGYSGSENRVSDPFLIKLIIDSWWDRYKVGRMEYITKFPKTASGTRIREFTIMAGDDNIRVGCAASRFLYDGFNILLMACNYATKNIFDYEIYASGTAASGCTTGNNPKYTNLCSPSERYI